MARRRRVNLIKKLEERRNSRMFVYITGDRRGFETKIATDVFPFILEHLTSFGSVKQIDLFLYTPGGLTIAASGLVSLVREFCERFTVLIPFKAHSAGTLIALGANSIVMSRVGQLSPVDPSITSPYNPTAPTPQPGTLGPPLPVNVEDVIGYLSLAKQEGGLSGMDALSSVFKELADKVHPLALGSVYRAREQIRMIAGQLLRTHMGLEREQEINQIATKLARELYSHDYIIGRKEAKETLGLPIEDSPAEVDQIVWQLYKEYEDLLQLTVPYNPDVLLGEGDVTRQTFTRAVIESTLMTHAFQTIKEIKRVQITPPGAPAPTIGFQERTISDGWSKNLII